MLSLLIIVSFVTLAPLQCAFHIFLSLFLPMLPPLPIVLTKIIFGFFFLSNQTLDGVHLCFVFTIALNVFCFLLCSYTTPSLVP
jgi:hypothetical protein